MNYQEAEAFLLQREMFGWKLGLERMEQFLAEMGSPHKEFASIHIAGTNGKGSVTAMLAGILRASGKKCGMYTSPHLQSLRERVQVDGEQIAPQAVVGLVERWRPLIERLQCTFFETMTGLAFRHFADNGVEIAAVEVGLGGRLDATNVLLPRLAVITNISYDHTDHLGTTLAAIAAEKAGIIKPGVPCVIGRLPAEAEEVIRRRAAEVAAPLIAARAHTRISRLRLEAAGSSFALATPACRYSNLQLPLPGPHQVGNSTVAAASAELLAARGDLPLPPPLAQGLGQTQWPGRFERILAEPEVVLDVAHNPGGFRQQRWMWRRFYPQRPLGLLLGLVRDKDLERVIRELPPEVAQIFAVPAPTHRGLPVAELTAALTRAGLPVTDCPSVAAGLEQALAWARGGPERLLGITGSHYVAGEVLQLTKSLTKQTLFIKLN